MSVASTAATNTSVANTATGMKSGTIDKEAFLSLLVTQLKYQDPLNPQDPSEFVSELAQFSTLEQLTNMSSSLDSLATKTTSAQWISAIGKRVNAPSSTLSPGDEVVISPQSDYDTVTLKLKDSSTGEVTTKTLYKGESLTYTNDGDSTYAIAAQATKNGTAVSAVVTVLKKIAGVSMSDTGNTLVFNDGSTMDATGATVITE
ncbi:MAG TPA: flagellar hook capping FlgD N-terminal domain-containing protein [Syntrophorhabdaceae bacterium]